MAMEDGITVKEFKEFLDQFDDDTLVQVVNVDDERSHYVGMDLNRPRYELWKYTDWSKITDEGHYKHNMKTLKIGKLTKFEVPR